MFKNKFVSLYFTPERLQLVELDSRKRKVVKFASIDLPDGLIKNYKVQDVNSMAKILASTWKKMRVKERAVGIVIPEFSTFSKLFSLPNLSSTELDEAIRWQAQEVLPEDMENMILDWKVVERQEGETQVLAVAMDKTILASYVKAAELAKLFPLVVETPSLSLARIAEDSDTSFLVVYGLFGEGTVTVSKGKRIYGSSVVGMEDAGKVAETAKRITSHYKNVNVEKVLVGGSDVTEELVSKLEDSLKKKVETLKYEIKGFNEAQVQEYLIPLSLQKKKAYEPANEETVNLLPVGLADKYKIQKQKVQVWSITLTITLLVWLSSLSALGSYLILSQQAVSLKNAVNESQQARENERITTEIKEINSTAKKVLSIKDVYVYPQEVLNDIDSASSSGIQINKYNLDLDKGGIEVEGVAVDRPTLITFKQSLEEKENYDDVVIPISSFEVESNLEFSMSAVYLPALPKKTTK